MSIELAYLGTFTALLMGLLAGYLGGKARAYEEHSKWFREQARQAVEVSHIEEGDDKGGE